MSVPSEIIEEALKKVEEIERGYAPPSPPSPPSGVEIPRETEEVRKVERRTVYTGRAVEALRHLCESVGGELHIPPTHPDKPLCVIKNVFGIITDFDKSRNVDVVAVHRFKGIEYRTVGKVRRREIVTQEGRVEIQPARSIKFEVDFYSSTKTATMPSLDITLGNYYDIVEISRRTRKLDKDRTVSLACTAIDSPREHKITCVLFPNPEPKFKFEFDERTKRWKAIIGKRKMDIFRGI